jgi:hypothetical protein
MKLARPVCWSAALALQSQPARQRKFPSLLALNRFRLYHSFPDPCVTQLAFQPGDIIRIQNR